MTFKSKLCTQTVYSFFAAQLGIEFDDWDCQLGCFCHDGFAALGGDIGSKLHILRFVAHLHHLQLLCFADQGISGSHWAAGASSFFPPITDVGHQNLALGLPL